MLVHGASGIKDSESVLNNTSGVFLFSCPILGCDKTRDLLGRLYKISPSSRFFADMGTSSAKIRKLADEFNQKVLPKDDLPKKDLKSGVENGSCTKTDASRRTGFPVIQYMASEEQAFDRNSQRATENLGHDRPVDRLDHTDSILVLRRNFESMLKFPFF